MEYIAKRMEQNGPNRVPTTTYFDSGSIPGSWKARAIARRFFSITLPWQEFCKPLEIFYTHV